MTAGLCEGSTTRAMRLACAACVLAVGATFWPAEAWAAQGQDSSQMGASQWAAIGAFLAANLLVSIIAILISIMFSALFVHIAAGITQLRNRSFGKACKTIILVWLLNLVLPALVVWLLNATGIQSPGVGLVVLVTAFLLPGTIAIMLAYDASFFASLITYILTFVVVLFFLFLLVLGLQLLLGSAVGS